MPHLCTDCDRRFDDGSKEMLSGCPDCGGNKFQFVPDGFEDAEATPPPEQGEPPEPPEPAVDSSVARTVGNAATAVRDLVSSGPSAPSSEFGAESTSSAASIEDDAQASARSEIVDPQELPGTAGGSSMGTAAGLSSVDRTTASDDRRSRSDRRASERNGRRQRTSPAGSNVGDTDSRDAAADGSDTDDTSIADDTDAAADSDDAVPQDKPELDDLREELNQQFESIRVLEPGQYELNLMELYDREEYIIALQEDGKYTIQVPERWED